MVVASYYAPGGRLPEHSVNAISSGRGVYQLRHPISRKDPLPAVCCPVEEKATEAIHGFGMSDKYVLAAVKLDKKVPERLATGEGAQSSFEIVVGHGVAPGTSGRMDLVCSQANSINS